jgi:hypothetical protein
MVKIVNHWEKKANGWVFLSHASNDYEDVKIIRNYLEENGFSALMFYLKCLEEESKKEKIEELIKWEIEARNIFVLCTSKTAKKSKWVKWETSFVRNLPNKIFIEIDVEKLKYQKCSELSKLDNLMNRATLFFSYSRKDNNKVSIIYEKLSSLGFRIFYDTVSIKLGGDIQNKMRTAFNEAIERGVVLIFLSKNAKKSKWFWHEKSMAINNNAFIIPIRIDDVNINDFPAFSNLQIIDMRDSITDESIARLVEIINSKGRI